MKIRHIVYNPQWGGLRLICQQQEQDGFILTNIIQSTQYEAVAIFVRPEDGTEEQEPEREVDENGSYL